MNKRYLILICVCLIFICPLNGQKITVIERNGAFTASEKQKEFYYIEKDFPLTDDRWVAILEGTCNNTKQSNLENLFYDFWETANAMGANAFFINDFSVDRHSVFVTVSIFNLTKEELNDNVELYSFNKIYVFGDLIVSTFKTKIPKYRKIKVNKVKIKVYPLSYYEYQSKIGEKETITFGGVLGSGVFRSGEAGNLSLYVSLGDGKFERALTPWGQGLSYSSGSIYPLDINFGQFLAEILESY